MSEPVIQNGRRKWIKVGWVSLILGWFGYFTLIAFSTRSPWMHTYAGYLALVFLVAVMVCVFMAWRKREGGHVLLLATLFATPVIWYFVSVAAMAFIAYQSGL